MIATLLPFDPAALGLGDSGTERASGLHASDIYNSLYAELEPQRYGREGDPPPLLLEIGLTFEEMMVEGLRRKLSANGPDIQRPGEFTYEGTFEGRQATIHYNPDLFIYNGDFRVGEVKATKMSPGVPKAVIMAYYAGDPDAREQVERAILAEKFAKYRTQLMLYCFFLRCLLGRFYILFINGCYKPDLDPILLPWDMTFTQDDLDTNYAACMYHALHTGMI